MVDEYETIIAAESEVRIQIMCNWSESIEEKSIRKERIDAIKRMIKANAAKEQIISYGYTESEYKKAESVLYANV